jgi:hypothetical protein
MTTLEEFTTTELVPKVELLPTLSVPAFRVVVPV